MATVFRWLVRLVTAMFVLVLAVGAVSYYFASRSLPDYDATLESNAIKAPVEIIRDNANVPHIFGANDADVFFGLGYAHAQDRLWQMTMLRRTAQGRLSELFGETTVGIDDLIRRLDLYPLAVSSVAAQDMATQDALVAYSNGVNAWLNQVRTDALGRGAPEMFMFNHAIAPWQPADSLAVLKVMALRLSGHLEAEVLRTRVSLMLPQDRLLDILPDVPGTGIAALPDYASLYDGLPDTQYAQVFTPHPLAPFKPRAFAGASNAWAAAPKRSASGSTLLANDPHLGFSAPSIWYLARIELTSGGVIGGTIPGVPAVMTGRSADLGWGLTSSYMDDQDLFIERLNPENPDEYQSINGYKPFLTRDSIIRIKDAPAQTIQLRWTDNGPVLPNDHYNLGTVTPAGHVASLSWAALSDKDTSMSAAIALMKSKTVQEAIDATEPYFAPSQNLSLVDGENIALKTIGFMPRRAAEHQTLGRLPAPGWVEANRWQGRANYSANPEFTQPDGGIIGNTNNKTVERPFPFHVSYEWGDSQRVKRWERLMQTREVHTRESFIEAQLDTVSFTARTLLPLIGSELWFTGQAAPEGTPERQRQIALDLLANWNGEMNEHLPEPLIYAAWVRALQERLIRDEMGPMADEFPHVEPLFIERVYRDVNGASAWCDVIQSAIVETCADISRLALDDAILWLTEKYGSAIESLRWGDAHEATHDHPVLGEVPVLRYFVNIRQSTSGGDNTLLRGLTAGTGPDPFFNVHGAGYRGVYDFADPDSSVFVNSTGQSGHFLSRHYDDLGELWRRGEYIPMSLDPDLARAASVGVTTILPAQN